MNLGYSRISQDRGGKRAGVETQREDIETLADSDGVELDELLEDNDKSATDLSKPRDDFERLCELVAAGRVERVYIWHADRLYRTYEDLLRLRDLAVRHPFTIRAKQHADIVLHTPDGLFTAMLLAGLAVREIGHKSERQRAAERKRASDGRPSSGGTRPLGYLADKMTIDPDEADALRTAAADLLAGGTLAQAARNVSAVVGRRIAPSTLRDCLTGPRIAGYRQYLSAADRRSGKTTPELAPAQWPAILDAETWSSLRTTMLDPARKRTRPSRRGLLSALLACDVCGLRLVSGTVTSGGKETDLYRCSGTSGCGRNTVTAAHVDAIVEEWARKRAESSTAVAARRVELARAAAHVDDAAASVEELEAKLVALAEMWADDKLSDAAYEAARTKVDARLDAARRDGAARVRRRAADRLLRDAATDWDGRTVEERRTVIRALAERVGVDIVVKPGRRGYRFDAERVEFRKAKRAA
jgi:DNA invertase Pin-like site-specific DNA recombinase